MKVLLVEPKFSRSWGKNNQHVGLLRIANWLKSTGHNMQYVKYPALPSWTPDEVYVTSMFTYDYQAVWEAVAFYKNLYPTANVLLGGIYATLCPEHAKQSGADIVSQGQHQEAREYPPDPSLLPYKQDFAYLFTSYGCDRACTYCATHLLFGKGIKQTEPAKVMEEIAFLRQRGFQEIWFGDDNILYNKDEHLKPLCELIIKSDLKMKFKVPGGMSAIDLDLETAKLMKRAGFKEFSFALESTNDDVRRKMGRMRHSSEDDIVRCIEILDSLDYIRRKIACYFIIGLPYQKLQDMVDTLCFLLNLGIEARPMRLTPIPGTIDWRRMGLQDWSLEKLKYSEFVAPEQEVFTHEDLRAITLIARGFTIQRRYIDWLAEADKMSIKTSIPKLFRSKLKQVIA